MEPSKQVALQILNLTLHKLGHVRIVKQFSHLRLYFCL